MKKVENKVIIVIGSALGITKKLPFYWQKKVPKLPSLMY